MSQKAEIVALQAKLNRIDRLQHRQARKFQREIADREAEIKMLRDVLIAKRVLTEDDVKREVTR